MYDEYDAYTQQLELYPSTEPVRHLAASFRAFYSRKEGQYPAPFGGNYMAATTKKIRWITKDEMDSIVNKRARAVLNISGKEFIRKRKSGAYSKLDADKCPGIIELALLAPSSKAAKPRARKIS